jgi:hypothetical protein
MPVWASPVILRGGQPFVEPEGAWCHAYWSIPRSMRALLDLREGELARIENDAPRPNVATFGRAIAKIGYCHAVMQYGLDGFRSLAVPGLILGKYPCVPYYVGSDLRLPPRPHPRGVMHLVHHGTAILGSIRLITVTIRLFAHAGTATNGMPYYQVVVGAEGRPTVISRRPSCVTPRVVTL